MKSLLLNLKNLIPYLLLIALYFLFVNIEAREEISNYKTNKRSTKHSYIEQSVEDKNLRISIPVIPYSQ